MRRVILGALALALGGAGLGGAGLAAPATAATASGSVTGVNGVLYDDCREYAYLYRVDVPDGAGYRALRTRLVAPGGAVADTGYVVPDANHSSGTSTFLLCTPTDPYGTYRIEATVEWGPEGSPPTDSTPIPDAHFSMRKPMTRTSLSVSTHRPAPGQLVTYRIGVRDERPAGYVATAFAWVFLQKKVDGHWVRIKGSRTLTHATGKVRLRLRYRGHHQRMRVRAVTAEAPRFSRSVSSGVRIW
jgi:hypothetical protein